MDKDFIKNSQALSRRCQRNWSNEVVDRSTVEFLTHIASHAPTKQNETHYGLCVVTDPSILETIQDDFTWGFHVYETNSAMRNTQLNAPLLFIYGLGFTTDESGDSHGADESEDGDDEFESRQLLAENRSIGISSGQLTLAANMLGLRTGFCQNLKYNAKTDKDWQELLGINDYRFNPVLAVGVGYPDDSLLWHESKDLEYLVADPHETDLDKKVVLDIHSTNRITLVDRKIMSYTKNSWLANGSSPKSKTIPLWIR